MSSLINSARFFIDCGLWAVGPMDWTELQFHGQMDFLLKNSKSCKMSEVNSAYFMSLLKTAETVNSDEGLEMMQ